MPGRFRPTGAWVYATIAPALAFIAANVGRNYQTDLWHHLARGRAIVRGGELLNHDIFTCTVAGKTFQDPNWLTQVLFFRLYEAGGFPLLQTLNALANAVVVAGVVYLCYRASGSMRLACAAGVLFFLGIWQLILIRPQTLSLVLFLVMYALLEAAAARRWLLVFPALMMGLWVNVHGAFPLGFILIGTFLFARIVEVGWNERWGVWRDPDTLALALCLLAGILATFVNPYGWNIYRYVGATSATAAGRQILEWLPPNPGSLSGKVWLASVMLTLIAFALPGRRPTVREVCLVLAFFALSCTAVRMVAWWFIIAAPILTTQLAAVLPRSWTEPEDGNASTIGDGLVWLVLVSACVMSVPGLQRYNPVLRLATRGPRVEDDLQAVADALEGGQGCIYSKFEWGEYLGWSLHPEYRVFTDGRIEIYPDQVWEQYEAVAYGRHDWQVLLDRYGATHLLLDRDHHRILVPLAEKSPQWQKVLEQGPAVLFERKEKGS